RARANPANLSCVVPPLISHHHDHASLTNNAPYGMVSDTMGTNQHMTAGEVGKLLRISARRVRDLARSGQIRALRVQGRGRFLFSIADVQAVLRPAQIETDVLAEAKHE